MIKIFCDGCGKEIESYSPYRINITFDSFAKKFGEENIPITISKKYELCLDCHKKRTDILKALIKEWK